MDLTYRRIAADSPNPGSVFWQMKCNVLRGHLSMRSATPYESSVAALRKDQAEHKEGSERRRHPRVPLHWKLNLACSHSAHPFCTKTQDISRDGFYCLLDQPLVPGELVECDIVVPAHRAQDPDDVIHLRCHARVVRVEEVAAGIAFGAACRMEDYSVIRGAPWGHV